MPAKTWFQTTAIDYPNSRPHIGTAFEKLGADVQARYRRMEGYDVFFLMGNDENTVKVSKRAAELGQDTQAYCDDMARQFREVWDALEISYDTFVQTSSERHKQCCRKFIQKVYDNGYIYKGEYEGWYCEGCEEFKSDKQYDENNGLCPNHKTPLTRRSEPCYFFKLSAFQDQLLKYYEENPDFIQPESRRNEIVSLIKTEGLRDINISRQGEQWGIRDAVRSGVHDLRLVRRAADVHHRHRLRRRRGHIRQVLAVRHPLHRQGHHALPLRTLAGDVVGRRGAGAEARLRARLRVRQERGVGHGREDQ